jgi:hypothetical protein
VITGVNDTVLPCTVTVTVRLDPDMKPNIVSAYNGFSPSSRVWKSSLTSRWRHAKSERVLTGLPLANLKGSGSFASYRVALVGVFGHVLGRFVKPISNRRLVWKTHKVRHFRPPDGLLRTAGTKQIRIDVASLMMRFDEPDISITTVVVSNLLRDFGQNN